MATKDERPTLLSKMAMFVRNPTKDWAELDRIEPDQESGYDKQALKAMIERKRQNDFVRKREFDNLRKLRRKDPAAVAGAARPSFFQSSMPADAEGRADTLKKIDEIEAQMSKQWWKGKQEAASVSQSASFPVASKASAPSGDSEMTDGSTMAPNLGSDMFAPTEAVGISRTPGADAGANPSEPSLSDSMPAFDLRAPVPAPVARGGAAGSGEFNPAISFSSSELFAIEAEEMATDPELEEAAIRFANSDDRGAESALIEALAGHAQNMDVVRSWAAALLDFYRATGQVDAFDRAVMDYAQCFDNLRPRWVDIKAASTEKAMAASVTGVQTAGSRAAVGTGASEGVGASPVNWVCPAELTESGMEGLRLALSELAPPWHLDWSALQDITETSVPLLSGLFGSLCAEEVDVRFTGSDRLALALRALTPSGNKTVESMVWTMRLDALRVMQKQDEFELAALDYCITYETAPPGWQDAKCKFLGANDSERPLGSDSKAGEPDTLDVASTDAGPSSATIDLRGQIVGDSTLALTVLGTTYADGAVLVVDCPGLLRVDFSAAGSILNWAAMRHSQGCQVHFRDVHRLVAAFFSVIGINEYARVTPRGIE